MCHDLRIEILKKFKRQGNFAMAMEKSETYVSRILSGHRKISKRKELERWLKFLKCDPELLLPIIATSIPKKCIKCGHVFKEGDKFYYDILKDMAKLNDLCEKCAKNISFMGYSLIPSKKAILTPSGT